MTAFVAPVLPLAFSRCGICNDMVCMGMVFVVGDEEGGGRGGGEDGDAVKSRERGLKLGGSRCPGAQEQWRDPAAAWHKLMWDHLQKKSPCDSGQGLAGEEWSVPTGPLGSWGQFGGVANSKSTFNFSFQGETHQMQHHFDTFFMASSPCR